MPRETFRVVASLAIATTSIAIGGPLVGGGSASADEPASGPTIVTLGDSITRGVRRGVSADQTFASLVERDLRATRGSARVVNVGVGGERSDQALARLDSILAREPDVVTVMYGTNDSYVDEGKTASRIPLDTYRSNLRKIIAALRSRGILTVLMTEPRWADDARPNGLGESPNVRLEAYVEACREVARDRGVPLVDHFAIWSAAREDGVKLRDWTTDGCHPDPIGHRKIAAALLPVLLESLERRRRSARIEIDDPTRERCLDVLRRGLAGDEFWPSMHAAEGLTLGRRGEEVVRLVTPRLKVEKDDQRRCGMARELVRAGARSHASALLEILAGDDDHGHVHAAESLYKVVEIGDGASLRRAFLETTNPRLKLMAAAALARCGSPDALRFLRRTLDHDDPGLYRIAAWVLGRIGDRRDIPGLMRNIARCPDEATRAYHAHALAALGDAGGLSALARDLGSDNAAIRTSAATFAGDARAVGVAGTLEAMLDDAHADARIRAAQSLLVLAGPPAADPGEDVSVLVYRATKKNPRYTEGSILELDDGSLLFAVTEFENSGSDFARARIVGRRSRDGGRTWSEPRILQRNTGGLNVMSVTLRRLRTPAAAGTIAMFYLEKNGRDDLDLLVRVSTDEAASFGPAVRITQDPGYHVVNNDRVTQLASGRLLAPAASTPDVGKVNHFVAHCYICDDGGRTWRPGKGSVDAPGRGAMEPEVVELRDGRLLMILRTQLGHIGKSYSTDGGDTWSEMESLGVRAPEAPATLRRIPSSGDLLLIWNDTFTPGAGHGGRRTPLTAALSADDGTTWRTVDQLESDPRRTYSYTSLVFVRDRAVMSYWESSPGSGDLSCRFRSLPVGRLHR